MSYSQPTGRCACGAVRFHVAGELSDVVACHCRTCRRVSGHYWAAAHADRNALTVDGGDALIWWRSSAIAERGFCRHCGSSLFYSRHGTERVSIAPGALDGATGLTIVGHICCAEAGDYYAIHDSAPQYPGPSTSGVERAPVREAAPVGQRENGPREGGCACGRVRFVCDGEPGPAGACHCRSCRRWSGHFWAAVEVDRVAFRLTCDNALRWWRSSAAASRGFCGWCGSSLFFDEPARECIEIAPGAFDGRLGRMVAAHIFCAEAGDYYIIDPAARHFAAHETPDSLDR
ncbi:GFA family protein [Salinisphaera sp.]|uniref:GFA family protein n=1 Tax=Salinisphaera sp. TaxID=1914330 RepID=UPI002D776996|nr:GFA family protein [Salinisphaera sp.]HET7313655.1 GFA family protein [Salinisphaera sp.]